MRLSRVSRRASNCPTKCTLVQGSRCIVCSSENILLLSICCCGHSGKQQASISTLWLNFVDSTNTHRLYAPQAQQSRGYRGNKTNGLLPLWTSRCLPPKKPPHGLENKTDRGVKSIRELKLVWIDDGGDQVWKSTRRLERLCSLFVAQAAAAAEEEDKSFHLWSWLFGMHVTPLQCTFGVNYPHHPFSQFTHFINLFE